MVKYFKIDKSFDLKEVSEIEKNPVFIKNPLEKYLDIGYYLLIPIIMFLIIGVYFDIFFRTKPLGIIIFLSVGVFISFYNLYRVNKEIKNERRSKTAYQYQSRKNF